ncbi:MAG: hypothetical protein DRP82_01280 [Planctomycetota bacterium]|nr:MAG: hypothetical protein DRP82_01280 [Planctomycetota bacterium]
MRWIVGFVVLAVVIGCGGNTDNKSAEMAKQALLRLVADGRQQNNVGTLQRLEELDNIAQEWADYHEDNQTPAVQTQDTPPSELLTQWNVQDLKEKVDQVLGVQTQAAEGMAVIIDNNSVSDAYDEFGGSAQNSWLMKPEWECVGVGYTSYEVTQPSQMQCYCWVLILVDKN